jgi:cbb3-type cytochrome c oxidase subunit II
MTETPYDAARTCRSPAPRRTPDTPGEGEKTMALSIMERHKKLERNITLLGICAFAAVTVGGIVEIAPLFWIDNTIEKVEGMRPYTPLEQAGRDIYVREGCYVCHSQMIRPFRDEVERYGHYSLAAESMYDHPFQWGSKRTGRILPAWAAAIPTNGTSST